MADLDSFMAAEMRLKCSLGDVATFQRALDEEQRRQEDDGWGSHEVRCDYDPDEGLLIYSECFGDDDLSDGVCKAVGELLKTVGEYSLEFTYCQSSPAMEPGSLGGGKFRIDTNGKVVWPKLAWS